MLILAILGAAFVDAGSAKGKPERALLVLGGLGVVYMAQRAQQQRPRKTLQDADA